MTSITLLRLTAVLAVIVIAAVAASQTHAQQEDDGAANFTPPFDLSLASKFDIGPLFWELSVKNNSESPVRSVKVQIDYATYIGSESEVYATQIWNIPYLPAGGTERSIEYFIPDLMEHHLRGRTRVPVRMYAEIIESVPRELPEYRLNNATGQWVLLSGHSPSISIYTNGDAGVAVVGASNQLPQVGESTSFTVEAFNVAGRTPAGVAENHDQFDVQVEISLSEGLVFAGDQPQAPAGTTFNPAPGTGAGIWDIGTIRYSVVDRRSEIKDISVAVNLTADSMEALPLAGRCLTAKVTRAWPLFEFNSLKRGNDIHTLCLGQAPTVVRQGPRTLFQYLDCVGRTHRLCPPDENTLQLFSSSKGHRPEDVIVQVGDPAGRHDGKWRTATVKEHSSTVPQIDGVGVTFQFVKSGYSAYTFAIDDVEPKERPGTFEILGGTSETVRVLDADTLLTRGPFNFTPSFASQPYPAFLIFGALGTYKVKITVGATKSGTAYTASGVYTFHVGPIAELAVRGSRVRSSLATPEQRAYTIHAINNGPDAAPAVEVTLTDVPEGAEAIVSEGSYREGACQDGFCKAVWDVGEMPNSEARLLSGKLPFPTLTLITDADAPASIRAGIANTQNYRVTIDGNVHQTYYLDHIESNNSATIAALPGTGEGAPGVPRSIRARAFPGLPFALLQWESVDMLNGWEVEEYEATGFAPELGQSCERPAIDAEVTATVTDELYVDWTRGAGENKCYAVRAVNVFGVPGYWSRVVSTSGSTDEDAGALPGIVLSERSVTVEENGSSAIYTVKLNRRPTGAVGVVLDVDDFTVATVFPSQLAFDADNWNVPQHVAVTAVNDNVDNANNRRQTTIRHNARGGGFDDAEEQYVAVTVNDDGDESGITFSESVLKVAGGIGEGSYTIRLDSQPTADVYIALESGSSDLDIHSGILRRFTPANWNRPQTIHVTFRGDDEQTSITHRARSKDPNYDGVAASIIVKAQPVALRPFVNIEGSSCVLGGEDAVFTLRTGRLLSNDLAVSFSVGSNWRVVPMEHRVIRNVIIPAGSASVEFTVPTQNPPEADQDIGDGRRRPYGEPGTVPVLIGENRNYDRGPRYFWETNVYHTSESHFCERSEEANDADDTLSDSSDSNELLDVPEEDDTPEVPRRQSVQVNSPATGLPSISGTAQVDETLTADASGIADADGLGTFSYRWLADGAAISGATGSSYALTASEQGKAISVRVSFTDGDGNAESVTSAATSAVAPAPSAQQGEQVQPPLYEATCTDNAYKIGGLALDAASSDGLSVSWTGLNCPGDYVARYWKTDDKANTFTQVTVPRTQPWYSAAGLEPETSYTIRVLYQDPNGGRPWKATPPLEATTLAAGTANNPATGLPSISGTAQVGETLTADASGIADADGLGTFSYQWLADGTAISGATGSSYTLTASEQGKAISITVSFIDGDGNAESVTSAATSSVM